METGLRCCRSSIDLKQCGTYQNHQFRSQWYKGMEKQMEWLRLSLTGPENLHVRVYACDDLPQAAEDVNDMTPAMERVSNDLLLYGVHGQYLCFTAEPCEDLTAFTLEFPGKSIDAGLPVVMQENETLRRLLGVYQSSFMDLNRDVGSYVKTMDPHAPDALPQLPRWLGASRWTQEKALFHKLLPYAHRLTQLRGTCQGLELLSKAVTGHACQIVEGWQMDQESGGPRDGCWLYGQAGEGITVLVPSKVTPEDAQQLRSLLPDFIPLGAPYKMVYLAENAPMDAHSYLDENVSLTKQTFSQMDDPKQDEIILE